MSVIANPTLTGNELDLARLQVGNGHYRAPYTRKNLLDNWYFVGGGDQQGGGQFPINQRKQTSYSGTGATIDRWWNHDGNVTSLIIGADGITMTASGSWGLRQVFENPAMYSGKTLTSSILFDQNVGDCRLNLNVVANGVEKSNWTTNRGGGLKTVTYSCPSNVTRLWVVFGPLSAGGTTKIRAVKLEFGDTQTLCHNEGTEENPIWVLNEIPDYTTQLLRCQRFFRVFTSTSTSTTGYGYSTNPKNLRPEMRATPSTGSFTYGGTTYYYLDANL